MGEVTGAGGSSSSAAGVASETVPGAVAGSASTSRGSKKRVYENAMAVKRSDFGGNDFRFVSRFFKLLTREMGESLAVRETAEATSGVWLLCVPPAKML